MGTPYYICYSLIKLQLSSSWCGRALCQAPVTRGSLPLWKAAAPSLCPGHSEHTEAQNPQKTCPRSQNQLYQDFPAWAAAGEAGTQTQVLCSQNPLLPSSPRTLVLAEGPEQETSQKPAGPEPSTRAARARGKESPGAREISAAGLAPQPPGGAFPPRQGTPRGVREQGRVGRQPWLCSERSGVPWMLFPA